jgi:hypothetical protein
MGNASTLAGFLLLFGAVAASPAGGQPATVDGAYARLSSDNAKVARALFDAQAVTPASSPSGAAGTTPTSAKPLTLDQISAMKQGGQSWGQVFQTMKTQRLVQDTSLGQVVSRYQQAEQQRKNDRSVVTAASPSSAAGGGSSK